MSIPASTAPRPKRHALGLPAGSVRSILALLVVLLLCSVLLLPDTTKPIPPYLLFLLFLIVGHFFASLGGGRGQASADHPRPLYLPGGFIRLAIVLILGATVAWKVYYDQAGLAERWRASVVEIENQWYMPIVLLGGFFVGVLVRMIVGRDNPPVAVQDFEAWLALIAVICLLIAGMIHLVISPATGQTMSLPKWEGFVSAIIAFYFGARS